MILLLAYFALGVCALIVTIHRLSPDYVRHFISLPPLVKLVVGVICSALIIVAYPIFIVWAMLALALGK